MTMFWSFSSRPLAGVGVMCAIVGGAMTAAAPAESELIAREVFFGNPDRANVQISPDGTRLSYLAPHEGVLNAWVQTIGKDDARCVTTAKDRPIRLYFWGENAEQIIYLQDRGGDENWRMYAVTLESGKDITLTPQDNIQARPLAMDRNFPDEILVLLNNRDPQLHDVWRINTRNGEGKMILQNDGYASYIADSNFNVRCAMRVTPEGGTDVFVRSSDTAPWTELVRWNMTDAANSSPLGFARDNATLYVADSRDADTARLFSFRSGGEKDGTYTMLASHDQADFSDATFDGKTGKILAAAFEYARTEWTILDESIRDDWAYLTSVADGEMNIASRNHDDTRWIVSYVRDDGPVEFYLYDRPAKMAQFLFTNRSQLEGKKLAKMKPVVIKSRDGLNLVSYLTTPLDVAPSNLPMVLLVHGGPWARDSWGYNGLHQWLANRGYAVLSVNFRGSTGFGKEFTTAGNRQWSAKMHDDLIDAVNWAVDQGIADPDRVAIMGGSYGGYATLVGLTFTPEFFACGVDIVGPSHVRTLLESIPPYWVPIKSLFETRVGALSEPEYLDQISPLTRVDKISRPLLIGQGANDPRVKQAESEQIVSEMQKKDLPVTYVLFPDEGHGFARPQNNMAFFAITEAFLAQHVGGRYEPIDDSVSKSTAEVKAGAELIPGLAGTGAQGSGQ